MSAATHTVDHDGRTLHVHEEGDPDGFAVFSHHGTPGCGAHYEPVSADARERGIRLLGIDRPGYGGSTRKPGRIVADAAADVAAVADALGIDRFGTVGGSGGGPHTLACAALLPDRVVGSVCIAGVAPFDAGGLSWFAGMGEDNVTEFAAALLGEEQLEPLLQQMAAGMSQPDVDAMLKEIGSLVGPEDRAVLDERMVKFVAANTSTALEPGVGGWIDDDLAFARDWGFDLGAIAVPVLVQHGRDDRFVPVAHGKWLADAIPGSDVHISARDGHLSLVRHAGAVHQWLLDQAG